MDIELHVSLRSGNVKFQDAWKYVTNNGELDVLAENDFVIATFAKGEWLYARRVKNPASQWPSPMSEEEDDEEVPLFGEGSLGFFEKKSDDED